MHLKRTIALLALAVGLVAGGPAAAQSGGHRAHARSDVPSRVANRVKRAEKGLDRATGYAEDGNDSSAVTALGSVSKNLAAAEKSAKRRVAAGTDNRPDAAYALAGAQHDVIGETSSLFDGAGATLVSSLNDTLNSAIDGRDDLIAAIGALSTSDQAAYADVLDGIDGDVTDEIDAIDEALADDTLTDAAKADLAAAKTKLQATQTTVQGLGASSTQSTASATSDGSGCDGDHGGQAGATSQAGQRRGA